MTNKGFADLLAASGPNGYRALKAMAFPDVWGTEMGFKVDGNAYGFDGRMFLKDILRDPHPEICVIKGAQLGVTVTALLRTLHRLCQRDWNILYLLPVKAGTTAFTQGRIDPMIASSPQLKSQFVAVDNANHKRTRTSNLYIRGTNVVTELREIPVDMEIWDERDKMKEENLPLAMTRMDGSRHKNLFKLSTPTITDFGIDAEYKVSDMRRWFIKCPHCSNQLSLDWDTHVRVDEDEPKKSRLECDHCHQEITHQQMVQQSQLGEWVVTNGDRDPDAHGYHISQLYSPTRQLYELIRIFMLGQTNVDFMRELRNSALGEGFVAEGDKLTEDVLDGCRDQSYMMPSINDVTDQLSIGVDVGSVLHVNISVTGADGSRRKVFVKTMQWAELWMMLEGFESRSVPFMLVIDANPERKMATDLAERFWGRVFLAFYNDRGQLAQWTYPKHRGEIGRVDIDRTVAIDTAHAAYIRRQVVLPANARELGEKRRDDAFNGFYKQMMSQTRVSVPNNRGESVSKYVQTGGPDHWDHSDTYEYIASTLIAPPAEELLNRNTGQQVTSEDIGMPDYFGEYESLVDYDPFGGAGFGSANLGPE